MKNRWKKLKNKYPGRYLAVSGSKVIASGFTAKEVLNQVGKKDLNEIRFIHVPETKNVFY